MTKEELALEVIRRLKEEYPDAGCTLDYDQAWKLLVSVRLAAQCTDARVNVVVEELYAKYPNVEALANADAADIEAIVKPCGLGKSKARDISACMKILNGQYEGKIPRTFEELFEASGSRKEECESDHGRCIQRTGNCHRYPLYPFDKPNWSGGQYKRTKKSGNGTVEDYPAQGGQ